MITIVGCLANLISGDFSIDIDSFLSYDSEELMDQLSEEFECENSFEKSRPFHDKNIWALMKEKYEEIIGASESGSNESSNDFINGFKVKYTLDYNKNNRRSIFVGENIKKGQVVYQHRSIANFPDVASFIRFLKHMPTDLLCDTIEWLNEWDDGDDGGFLIDFDDISYISHEGKINIRYYNDNDYELVALRDINAGEELIGVWIYFDNEDSTAGILRELNNCEEVEKKKRPIFGKPLWILMQKIYEDLTNETMSSDDFGFRVKYSVNYSKTHGRGLFAREKIQKGEIVYEHKRDIYLTPETYPDFLNRLVLQVNKQKVKNQELEPYLDFLNISPAGVICDMNVWTYGRTKTQYNLHLDDMSYCNGAASISGANIEYSDDEGKALQATRDIDAGEEILCEYAEFY